MAGAPKAKGRRLVGFVHVDGQVYGPDSDVPAEVAKQITNPNAWGESEADAKGEAPADESK